MKGKYVLSIAVCLVFALWFMSPALAQQSNNEILQKRIDELEQEVKELKLLLQQQQKASEAEKARVDKVEQKVEQAEKSKAATPSVASAPSILSDFKFKPYGFIKLDAAYDDSRTNYGNFVLYVPNEALRKNDNEFNMTARQTQIGIYILAPEVYSWAAKGRFEFDLYGDGTQHENKAEPLLRHAMVELTKGNIGIIAGQTFDLISPLTPNTLNYTVGWAAGNIGYRRPQFRFTYNHHPLNECSKIISALAIARTEGLINEDLDLDKKNDGEDAGFPTVQARLAYATKLFAEKESVFGISGHYGEEEIDWGSINPRDDQKRVKSWSLNGDFEIPLAHSLAVKGEAFVGYNLDDYFGGILQGINSTTHEVIKTIGGWSQLSYQYNPQWKYNVGFGIDDPRNDDLSNGMRSRNMFCYGNVLYNLIPPLNIGLEYSFWDTEHLGKSSGTNNRIQTSVIYSW